MVQSYRAFTLTYFFLSLISSHKEESQLLHFRFDFIIGNIQNLCILAIFVVTDCKLFKYSLLFLWHLSFSMKLLVNYIEYIEDISFPIFQIFFFVILFGCVCAYVCSPVWRSEDTVVELVLSFTFYMCSWYWTPVITLVDKCLHCWAISLLLFFTF